MLSSTTSQSNEGKMPTKDKRTPVLLTDAERAEIKVAMKAEGIRSMSDFLRLAALRLARGNGE
jgi:hypothetical protein